MKSVYVFPPKLMPDAVLSQANPVSATLYTVLATTNNVRLISVDCTITWATTQPTPLDVVVTIDGQSKLFTKINPASGYRNGAVIDSNPNTADDLLLQDNVTQQYRAFLLEGRSVKVQARITWATTQPTPLVCRVKYAKY